MASVDGIFLISEDNCVASFLKNCVFEISAMIGLLYFFFKNAV